MESARPSSLSQLSWSKDQKKPLSGNTVLSTVFALDLATANHRLVRLDGSDLLTIHDCSFVDFFGELVGWQDVCGSEQTCGRERVFHFRELFPSIYSTASCSATLVRRHLTGPRFGDDVSTRPCISCTREDMHDGVLQTCSGSALEWRRVNLTSVAATYSTRCRSEAMEHHLLPFIELSVATGLSHSHISP